MGAIAIVVIGTALGTVAAVYLRIYVRRAVRKWRSGSASK